MADLGTLAIGLFDLGNSTWDGTIGSTSPLEVIGSFNDSNYAHDDDNTTAAGETEVAYFALEDMPSDFGDIDTLLLNLRYFRDANTALKTWDTLTARVYDSTLAVAYTDLLTVASSITNTTGANSGATGFTINATGLAASKANWNGAVLALHIVRTKEKGGNITYDLLRKTAFLRFYLQNSDHKTCISDFCLDL